MPVGYPRAAAALLAAACGGLAPRPAELGELGEGFTSAAARVNGTTLHYVRGGAGPAVLLVHGFPEDWSAYLAIMPRLARRFTVVAVDLRGIGGSGAAAGGYDAANLAEDVHQLAEQLRLERPYVVGHDVGGMVVYAYARRYPTSTRGAMLLEAALPGLDPWDELKAEPGLWHMAFHQTPEVPEKLLAGRHAFYFREQFFKPGTADRSAIDDAKAARYAAAYATPEQLRAGLEIYRAFPANEKINAAQRDANDVPLVLAGGERSFAPLSDRLARALREHGCSRVAIEVIAGAAHYVIDEKPERVAELIERYASSE